MAIVNKVEECTWPAHCWLSAVLEPESSFLDRRNEYQGFRKVGAVLGTVGQAQESLRVDDELSRQFEGVVDGRRLRAAPRSLELRTC